MGAANIVTQFYASQLQWIYILSTSRVKKVTTFKIEAEKREASKEDRARDEKWRFLNFTRKTQNFPGIWGDKNARWTGQTPPGGSRGSWGAACIRTGDPGSRSSSQSISWSSVGFLGWGSTSSRSSEYWRKILRRTTANAMSTYAALKDKFGFAWLGGAW